MQRQLDWGKINRVRNLIRDGTYWSDQPPGVIVDAITSEASLFSISAAIEACPVGEGDAFRDLIAEAMISIFVDAIDVPLTRREASVGAGRVDLEVSWRSDAIDRLPLLRRWQNRFDALGLMIEAKNETKPIVVDDVRQISDYLETSSLTKVGLLVHRSGITKPAVQRLFEIAASRAKLILPISSNEIRDMVRNGISAALILLHRREVMLLQRQF